MGSTPDYGTWGHHVSANGDDEAASVSCLDYFNRYGGTWLCLLAPVAVGARYLQAVPGSDAVELGAAALSLYGLIRLMHACAEELEQGLSAWLSNIVNNVNSAAPILIASLVARDTAAAQHLLFGSIAAQLLLIFSSAVIFFSCGRRTATCEPRPHNSVTASVVMLGTTLLCVPSAARHASGAPDTSSLAAVLLLCGWAVSVFSVHNTRAQGVVGGIYTPCLLWVCAAAACFLVITSASQSLSPVPAGNRWVYGVVLPVVLVLPSVLFQPNLDEHVSSVLLSTMSYVLLLAPALHFTAGALPLAAPAPLFLFASALVVKLLVSCNHVTSVEGFMVFCSYILVTVTVSS